MEESKRDRIEGTDAPLSPNKNIPIKKPQVNANKIVVITCVMLILLISVLAIFLLDKKTTRQNNYPPRGIPVPKKQVIKPTALPTSTPTQTPLSSIPVYQQMLAKDKSGYDYAISKGAQFIPTKDGSSFFMYWKPDGWTDNGSKKIIVNLSGHETYVSQGFSDWYGILTDKNEFAIASIQWWDGEGEKYQNYYNPEEIMTEVSNFLSSHGFSTKDLVVLHGFSRGAANSYAVSAIDSSQNKYFDFNIANAGGATLDFPGNIDIQNGKYGAKPFSSTKWILFCGEKDENPTQSGCPGMKKTQAWLEKYGATIILFLKDPTGDHGAFMKKPSNAKNALNTILSQ